MALDTFPDIAAPETAVQPHYKVTRHCFHLNGAGDVCAACSGPANMDVWMKPKNGEAPLDREYALLCAACFGRKIREVFNPPKNAVIHMPEER